MALGKTIQRLTLGLTAALLVGTALPQGLPHADAEGLGLSAERLERVDALIEDAIEREQLAGAVALIARRGQIAYLESFGMADIDDGEPMEVDSLFRIASMTKAVTSLAVMMLFEEGLFLLDDPVSHYIPAFANPRVLAPELGERGSVPAQGEITIRHLLTHTSGLSYRFLAAPGPTETIAALYRDAGVSDGLSQTPGEIADLSAKLGELPLLFEPGTQYSYSLSVDVLGHLVEVVSGLSLDEFFRTRIFAPLGMEDTHFFLDAADAERLASIYTPADTGGIREVGEDPVDEGYLVYSASYPYNGPRSYFSGGGGLTSTAADYARFLQLFLNGGELDGERLLSPKTVAMMTRNSIGAIDVAPGIKFGLGFAIVEDPGLAGDPRSAGTYYWGGFFNTRYFVDPSEQLIGIFMSQRYPQGPDRIRDRFASAVYQAIVE